MEKSEGELIIMVFNYYYGSEADLFNFIRIPKRLITDPSFAELSLSAKLLYGILLDRMSLSMKNKWLDKENRVYIIYQISEIMENLNMAEKTAIKTLKELEAVGLVEKKRRGLGLPSLLYVKNFIIDDMKQEKEEDIEEKGIQSEGSSRTGKLYSSRPVENEGSRTVNLEVQEQQKKMALISKTDFSDTDFSKTDTNHTKSNQIILDDEIDAVSAYQELIRENIDYDLLIERHPYDRELIEGIYNLLIEVVLNQREMMIVSSSELPTALVKSRFLKLNFSHIEYSYWRNVSDGNGCCR